MSTPVAPEVVAVVPHDHASHVKSVELERLVFFSDAVVAIAITLLVLELRLPDTLPTHDEAGFGRVMIGMIPMMFSFAFSFFLVGMYWFAHHRIYRYIRRWDGGLVAHNFHFLFWIALLPFAVTLMGRFGGLRGAVVVYGVIQLMVGIAQFLMWRHATRDHRLVDPHLDASLVRLVEVRSLTLSAIALLSIGVAFVAPRVWMAWWTYALSWPAIRLVMSRFGARGRATF